jgi:hypothetical protein
MTEIFVFMIELSHLTKNNPHLVSKSHLPQFGDWNRRRAEAGDLCPEPARGWGRLTCVTVADGGLRQGSVRERRCGTEG